MAEEKITTSTKKTATKSSSAKASTKKSAAKSTAKKSAAKPTVKSGTAKKSTAKPAAKKVTTAKKSTATKKPTAKKSTATKKPAAKSSTAKKPAAKVETKKATTAKKGTAEKKTTSKKPASSAAEAAKKAASAAKSGDTKRTGFTKKTKASSVGKSADKKANKKSVGTLQKGFLKKGKAKKEPPVFLQRKNKEEEDGKKQAKRSAKRNRDERYQRVKRRRVMGVVALSLGVLIVALFGFKIAGALTINAGYAAKVADTYIKEDDVTKYIKNQTYYKQYSKSSSGWAQFLSMYGMTPDKFREQVINDKFVHDELVKLAAEKEEITVDESKVDAQAESFKAKYTNTDSYHKALDQAGYTEESYKENAYQSEMEKALCDKVCPKKDVSDEDASSYLSTNLTVYKDARRTSHILFDTKDENSAQEVLDKINSGALAWDAAVQQYSKDESTKAKAGDRGWDKIVSFSTAYNNALSGLDAGAVNSSLVKDSEGIHIIKCTEKWNTPEKLEGLKGVPQDIINDVKKKKAEETQKTDLKTWLDTFKSDNNIDVVIYPMPNDVPYNVDTTKANKSSATGAATESSSPVSTE